jgi:hypothetical protein
MLQEKTHTIQHGEKCRLVLFVRVHQFLLFFTHNICVLQSSEALSDLILLILNLRRNLNKHWFTEIKFEVKVCQYMLSHSYVTVCVQVSVTLAFRNTLLLEFYKNMLIKMYLFCRTGAENTWTDYHKCEWSSVSANNCHSACSYANLNNNYYSICSIISVEKSAQRVADRMHYSVIKCFI